MPAPDLMIAFFVATFLFGFMPGPGMLYATAQTLARGRKAGWFAALGLHIGGYVHVFAAALGLAILFETVPLLYTAVKLAGAVYLIYLGSRLLFARPPDVAAPALTIKTPKRAFWESVTVEVLNPKTAIFYLAFLPQFTDPNAALAISAQLLILGIIVNVVFSLGDLVCVFAAASLSAGLQRGRTSAALIQRLGGSILIALGIKLATSRG